MSSLAPSEADGAKSGEAVSRLLDSVVLTSNLSITRKADLEFELDQVVNAPAVQGWINQYSEVPKIRPGIEIESQSRSGIFTANDVGVEVMSRIWRHPYSDGRPGAIGFSVVTMWNTRIERHVTADRIYSYGGIPVVERLVVDGDETETPPSTSRSPCAR